jgi:hypothetical protein
MRADYADIKSNSNCARLSKRNILWLWRGQSSVHQKLVDQSVLCTLPNIGNATYEFFTGGVAFGSQTSAAADFISHFQRPERTDSIRTSFNDYAGSIAAQDKRPVEDQQASPRHERLARLDELAVYPEV